MEDNYLVDKKYTFDNGNQIHIFNVPAIAAKNHEVRLRDSTLAIIQAYIAHYGLYSISEEPMMHICSYEEVKNTVQLAKG